MKIGIKDGKIWDICSKLSIKRDNSIPDKDYLDIPMGDFIVEDTWIDETKTSLKDSPQRFVAEKKTSLELRIETLENKVESLETK